jgi:3-isopropylmalate/(R)-2-methylmalate dehydratase small subunit
MYNPAIPGASSSASTPCAACLRPAGLPAGRVPFIDQTDPDNTRSVYTVIVGEGTGCGSSRARPLALAEAGIKAVVAEFYARIFFRNSVNGGYVLPCETTQRLVEEIRTGDECELDIAAGKLTNKTTGKNYPLRPLGDVKPIIEAGGVFEYARQTGMLKK